MPTASEFFGDTPESTSDPDINKQVLDVFDADIDRDKSPRKPTATEFFSDSAIPDNSRKELETPASALKSATSIAEGIPAYAQARAGLDMIKHDAAIKQLNEWRGRLPDVDYETGLPFKAEVMVSRADTPAEKETALRNLYPDASIGRDKRGNVYVELNGKKIAANTGGSFFTHKLPVALASSIEPIAGMAGGAEAGAALGTPFAPFTAGLSIPVGGIIGAGVGGALGKGVQEEEKAATGYYDKSLDELKSSLESEAGWSAAGEGAGRVLLGVGRATRHFPTFLGDQTAESNKLTEEALQRGFKPPIAAAAPGATKTQYTQAYIEKVIGNHRELKNAVAIDNQLKGSLKSIGFDDAQADKAMQDILTGKIDSRAYGEQVANKVKTYVDDQEKAINSLSKDMDKILSTQFSHIEKNIGSATGNAGDLIKTDIETARTTFSQTAGQLYGRVDAIVGDAPLVPTERIKLQAQSVLDKLPKVNGETVTLPGAEGVAAYLQKMTQLDEKVTFSQAQILRSQFNQLGLATDLTPGIDKRLFRDLASSVDGSFNDVQSTMGSYGADALRKADDFYRENIKKFKNVMATRLTREAGMRGAVAPEDVISYVAKPGYASRLSYIMKMTSPETQAAIRSEDFSQVIKKTTNPVTGEINGKALLKQVTARDKTGEILYGKDWKAVKLYAARLAARDGEVPMANRDRFVTMLKMQVEKQDRLERFMQKGDNYLAALSKPGFEFREAVNYIVQPGKEVRLEKAIEFFGENSQVVKDLRKNALVKIFSDAGGGSTEPLNKVLQSDKLLNELNKYSDRQLALLFPNGLDKELKRMAEVIKFSSKEVSQSKMAAGLAAGVTKLLPLVAVKTGHWGYLSIASLLYVGDFLLQRPTTLRWFGPGLYGDNMATDAIRQLFKNVPRSFIQSFSSTEDK
ncbi:MAG: hypothetical protein EPO08_20835 [Rhodospirillaceae bacterium]|nr:MAG: hypothetical protein EPO08_20835 [Rhodospirillaceae bacterium]